MWQACRQGQPLGTEELPSMSQGGSTERGLAPAELDLAFNEGMGIGVLATTSPACEVTSVRPGMGRSEEYRLCQRGSTPSQPWHQDRERGGVGLRVAPFGAGPGCDGLSVGLVFRK